MWLWVLFTARVDARQGGSGHLPTSVQAERPKQLKKQTNKQTNKTPQSNSQSICGQKRCAQTNMVVTETACTTTVESDHNAFVSELYSGAE